MNFQNLRPGDTYTFVHKRKGKFEAKFIRIEQNQGRERVLARGGEVEGDPDRFMLRVEIVTSDNTPYARFANAYEHDDKGKHRPATSVKLLRPSLITNFWSASKDRSLFGLGRRSR